MSTIQKNTLNEQSLDCESIKWTERTKKIRFEAKDDNRYDATKTQFWEKEISGIKGLDHLDHPFWKVKKNNVKHSTGMKIVLPSSLDHPGPPWTTFQATGAE